VNLSAVVKNSATNFWDYLGLANETIDTRNPDVDKCPCSQDDINKVGAKYSKLAADSTRNFQLPADAYNTADFPAEKPEFGGNICCNLKTKEVTATGPVKGRFEKTERFEGKFIYVGGAFDSTKAPPCPKGTKVVAVYHSHPDGSKFSKLGKKGINDDNPSDELWTAYNKIPLFLGNQNGELLRLDHIWPMLPSGTMGERQWTTSTVSP